jgi:hypothetical protein
MEINFFNINCADLSVIRMTVGTKFSHSGLQNSDKPGLRNPKYTIQRTFIPR